MTSAIIRPPHIYITSDIPRAFTTIMRPLRNPRNNSESRKSFAPLSLPSIGPSGVFFVAWFLAQLRFFPASGPSYVFLPLDLLMFLGLVSLTSVTPLIAFLAFCVTRPTYPTTMLAQNPQTPLCNSFDHLAYMLKDVCIWLFTILWGFAEHKGIFIKRWLNINILGLVGYTFIRTTRKLLKNRPDLGDKKQ